MKSLKHSLKHINEATNYYWLLCLYLDQYSYEEDDREDSEMIDYTSVEKTIKLNARDEKDAYKKAQKELDKLHSKDENWIAGTLVYGPSPDDYEDIETLFAGE